MNYFNELLTILNEMSPYLILGFFISGLLHVYVPKNLYARFLHRRGLRSVVGAALLGVPIPLCSCGVIPTAMSLRKEGASDGATVAFLVGTPQTGVDSILATYSLLGLPFAIIRPVASLIVAIFGGVLVDTFGGVESKKIDYTKMRFSPDTTSAATPTPTPTPTCGCGCDHSRPTKPTFKAALRYGFVEIMHDFGKWLLVGLFIAAAITAFVPDSVFVMFKEHYMLNILLILIVSVPMYVCATGSIPIALSLMLKGVSPGAAFVLLLAGPATNLASLIILKREIGVRKTIIYLISIIIGAIVCAVIIDQLLPQDWFSSLLPMDLCCDHDHAHDHAHSHDLCTHGPVWWQTICSAVFVLLFLNSVVKSWIKGKKSCCDHNH